MTMKVLSGLAFGSLVALSSTAHAATLSLIGTDLSLSAQAQATPTSELFVTSFPVTATVSATEVEFPDVASLFDSSTGVPPGFASSLVDVSIDAGSDFLEIDFTNSAPFTDFATGFQNTYVFTFDSAVALDITDAVIDTNVTTLGLTGDRVTFSGNELFVNVQSLTFNTSTFARINLTAEDAMGSVVTDEGSMGSGMTDDPERMPVVPLPAGMPLIITAMIGLGVLSRQKKTT